jgi:hypothetical protein
MLLAATTAGVASRSARFGCDEHAMRIQGRCHCGNFSFMLDWTGDPATIPARACTCTFCTRHGAAWTSCPGGSLRIRIGQPSATTTYRFGTGTADFHVCTRCGVAPVVTSRIDDRLYAVVNVRTFEDVDPERVSTSPSSVDGEIEDARLARRARNWIGDVAFVDA